MSQAITVLSPPSRAASMNGPKFPDALVKGEGDSLIFLGGLVCC